MVKEFSDESGITNLRSKIEKVHADPEPTRAEYLNPIPLNLRRNENVQKQQTPTDQTEDEHTKVGERRKALEAAMSTAEQEFQLMKLKEKEEPGYLKRILKVLPSPAQMRMTAALLKGDLHKFTMALESSQREEERKLEKKINKEKAKKAALEKEIAKLDAESKKRKAKKHPKKK